MSHFREQCYACGRKLERAKLEQRGGGKFRCIDKERCAEAEAYPFDASDFDDGGLADKRHDVAEAAPHLYGKHGRYS